MEKVKTNLYDYNMIMFLNPSLLLPLPSFRTKRMKFSVLFITLILNSVIAIGLDPPLSLVKMKLNFL
jgi:uncharacterized membrane protein